MRQPGPLLELAGQVAGARVLDIACGHGRMARRLASRGARVTGVDISAALLARAEDAERRQPLGIRYLQADAASADALAGERFDVAVCSFSGYPTSMISMAPWPVSPGCCSLAAGSPSRSCTRASPAGRSWPATGSHYEEGWWRADGAASTLRRQVGANHRTLSTYVAALRRHGLWLDALTEPLPPAGWAVARPAAARMPVFLAVRCLAWPAGPPPED